MEAKEKLNDLKFLAGKNLIALGENPYPGRGIVVGIDESGKYLVQAYWIMGRSENSRNRVFVIEDEGVLKTEAADPEKVKDPSLIIYTAMAEVGTIRLLQENKASSFRLKNYAVSNGHQTLAALVDGGLNDSMRDWRYEPDEPNYTPRISALVQLGGWARCLTEISILKKSPLNQGCDKYLYKLDINSLRGLGYCVTTYSGDGNPLPSFSGDPYLLPLEGNIGEVAQMLWDNLNEENRVSLAVKFVEIETKQSKITVINKYTAV
jgi:hypothetical protein